MVKRTITGRSVGRTMTLGDLRRFLDSLEGIGDDAPVKARVTLRKRLRAVTIEEEEDNGLQDYLRAIGLDEEPEAEEESAPARTRTRK